MSNRLLVLGWHNVDPTPAYPAEPGSGRAGFERQLRLLGRAATVIRLSEAAERIEAGEPLPPRAVALTFDDGYQDSLDAAVPILRRQGMPATFFLVPGFLSRRLGAWWEDFAHLLDTADDEVLEYGGTRYDLRVPGERARARLELPPRLKALDARAREDAVARMVEGLTPGTGPLTSLFLDWDGARELVEAGHDVGSHSDTHAILSREAPAAQAAELADSRSALESRLATTVDTLAYPNGGRADYDETTMRCAREIGYRVAVTVEAGLADRRRSPYELKRLVLTPQTDARATVEKVFRRAREKAVATVPALGGPRP